MTVMIALTTVPDSSTAERLAQGLLERRLVACVNIVPGMHSHFWWQGAVKRSDEMLVIMKTHSDRWGELEAFVRDHHPYDVPELVAFSIWTALDSYLKWIAKETQR